MTVSQINQNQIKIILSNTEVLGCFGAYEKLTCMSSGIKSSLYALVREILTDYGFDRNCCKILAKIKVKKPLGCEITISAIQKRYIECAQIVFEFKDFEELTRGILQLYKMPESRRIKSSLYKLENCFSLIIKGYKNPESFFIMNEFCYRKFNSEIAIAHTEEYGKLLIENNAIEKYVKFFCSKGT